MAKEYLQGKFTPRNPQKYIGNVNNITFRSSWEKKLFIWLDETPNILKWNSEEFIIDYISPVDRKKHRYYVDCAVEYKTKDNIIKKALIEVKPKNQTEKPQQPKRMTKYFAESVKTYAINQAKWEAATRWCKERNWDFIILTEEHLFPSKKY